MGVNLGSHYHCWGLNRGADDYHYARDYGGINTKKHYHYRSNPREATRLLSSTKPAGPELRLIDN